MKITDEAVQAALSVWFEEVRENEISTPFASHFMEKMQAALTAALPYLQAGYAVKQLEWAKVNSSYRADSDFCAYIVREWGDGAYLYYDYGTGDADYPSVDEAKAAAQADFERRVREFIVDGVDVAEVRNMVEKLIKAADEVVFHFGDNDSGFSIPSVNDADYICTSLGDYHEARAKLVSLIGDLSVAPTEEAEL